MKIQPFNYEQNGNLDPTLVEIVVERWQEDSEAVATVLSTPDGE